MSDPTTCTTVATTMSSSSDKKKKKKETMRDPLKALEQYDGLSVYILSFLGGSCQQEEEDNEEEDNDEFPSPPLAMLTLEDAYKLYCQLSGVCQLWRSLCEEYASVMVGPLYVKIISGVSSGTIFDIQNEQRLVWACQKKMQIGFLDLQSLLPATQDTATTNLLRIVNLVHQCDIKDHLKVVKAFLKEEEDPLDLIYQALATKCSKLKSLSLVLPANNTVAMDNPLFAMKSIQQLEVFFKKKQPSLWGRPTEQPTRPPIQLVSNIMAHMASLQTAWLKLWSRFSAQVELPLRMLLHRDMDFAPYMVPRIFLNPPRMFFLDNHFPFNGTNNNNNNNNANNDDNNNNDNNDDNNGNDDDDDTASTPRDLPALVPRPLVSSSSSSSEEDSDGDEERLEGEDNNNNNDDSIANVTMQETQGAEPDDDDDMPDLVEGNFRDVMPSLVSRPAVEDDDEPPPLRWSPPQPHRDDGGMPAFARQDLAAYDDEFPPLRHLPVAPPHGDNRGTPGLARRPAVEDDDDDTDDGTQGLVRRPTVYDSDSDEPPLMPRELSDDDDSDSDDDYDAEEPPPLMARETSDDDDSDDDGPPPLRARPMQHYDDTDDSDSNSSGPPPLIRRENVGWSSSSDDDDDSDDDGDAEDHNDEEVSRNNLRFVVASKSLQTLHVDKGIWVRCACPQLQKFSAVSGGRFYGRRNAHVGGTLPILNPQQFNSITSSEWYHQAGGVLRVTAGELTFRGMVVPPTCEIIFSGFGALVDHGYGWSNRLSYERYSRLCAALKNEQLWK